MKRADFSENQTRKPLVDELEAAGAVVLPIGVRCPFHDDKHASGSIYQGKDGAWRYHCHTPTCGVSGDVYDLRGMAGKGATSTSKPSPTPSKKNTAPTMGKAKKTSPRAPVFEFAGLRASITGEIEAEYPYLTPDGEVWGVVFRLRMSDGKKSFRQARPVDGKWEWGAPPKPWILFHLEEIQNAREIVVVEGEKAAEALRAIGEVATTSLCGAGKGAHTDWSPLAGKRVYLWPDNDEPGQKHMQEVKSVLQSLIPPVDLFWIEPQALSLPEKGDAFDFIRAGGTAEGFKEAASPCEAIAGEMEDQNTPEAPAKGEPRERINQADTLLKVLNETGVDLFHDSRDDGFIAVPIGDHTENFRIASTAFRKFLNFKFYAATGKTLSAEALKRATDTLDARAVFEGSLEDVFLRYGSRDDKIYVDLCDPEWQTVEIDRHGYRVIKNPPVRFVRSRGMLAMPIPKDDSHGNISQLKPFINCSGDDDFKLIVSWILTAMRHGGKISYPVLCFNGEQGSSKSTVQRFIRSLVDPNATPLRQIPRNEQDLIIGANLGWILSYDNLSNIKPDISDSLCKVATEGGFSCRKLYTDDEEITFNVRRPILLNGIESLINRSDLLDRSVVIELMPIPHKKRLAETTVWEDFQKVQQPVFEGFLWTMVEGLKRLPNVRIPLERMADFCKWGAAVAPALGWSENEFLGAFRENQRRSIEANGENDPVMIAIDGILGRDGILYGSASELHREMIGFFDGHVPFDFPKTARGLVGHITRIRPSLRRCGIEHLPPRGRSNKHREHIIRKMAETTAPTAPPPPSDTQDEQNQSLTVSESGGGCGGGCESSPPYRPPYRPQQKNTEVEYNQVLMEGEGAEGRSGRSFPAFIGDGDGPKRRVKEEVIL